MITCTNLARSTGKRTVTLVCLRIINQSIKRNLVDLDADGTLNYDEFKAVWTGFAAVHSQLNFDLYDANNNYMLDPEEIAVWKQKGEEMMAEWGWNITPKMEQAFQRIWIETDVDKDYQKRSFMECTNFFLGQWAYLINN